MTQTETPETTNPSTRPSREVPSWARSARDPALPLVLRRSLPPLTMEPVLQPWTVQPPSLPVTPPVPVEQFTGRLILQRLDPEARRVLSQKYVFFHDNELQYHPTRTFHPWKPEYRTHPSPLSIWSYSCYPTTFVDYDVPDASKVRVYMPRFGARRSGVPALLWCSGGGMVLGNIDSDQGLLTRIASKLQCAVVQIDYRRAPEHPYPTPGNDVAAGYEYVYRNRSRMGLNGCFVLGGASAGANLAFVTALRRVQAGLPMPVGVLLVAPAQLDNTLTVESFDGWRNMQHAPWTGVDAAMSFRQLYLPRGGHAIDWQQNPLNFPDEILKDAVFPPTFNLLMGVDLFLEEGKMLTARLRQHAHVVREKIFPGLPHMAPAMGRMFPEVLREIRKILKTFFTVDAMVYHDLPGDHALDVGMSPQHWLAEMCAEDDEDVCQCNRTGVRR